MKNKKLKNETRLYALRGFVFGLVIALIIILLATDSVAYHNSNHTLSDYIDNFPGIWVVVALPILCAVASYLVSNQLAKVIRQKNNQVKEQERRSASVLKYVEALGQGDYSEIDSDDNDEENDLVQSLEKLRKTLKQNTEEEQRRRDEEERRGHFTEGVTQIGEILRRSQDNMEELSYNVISYLVKFLEITQGGFFILNKEDEKEPFFELTGFIAYGRKKFADKKILWGEGLIGRCGLEKETIYMTELPQGYMAVTSGLSNDDTNPKSLLIVPLKSNDEMYGAIEMASLREFDRNEIEFVEKTADSIALTISNVQNNIRTQRLLHETQEQTQKMRQQEDELRQNMEEMRATQEENVRREAEMRGLLAAIDESSISAEFELDGTIRAVNENFLKTFGYTRDEVLNQNMTIFFFDKDKAEFETILESLQNSETFNGRACRRNKRAEEVWLQSTYSPVIDEYGQVLYVKTLESDISEQVKLEKQMEENQKNIEDQLAQARWEMKEQFKEIEAAEIRNKLTLEGSLDAIITVDHEGTIIFFNKAAENLWGYNRNDVLEKNVTMLFDEVAANSDEFLKAFLDPNVKTIIGERREVPIKNKFGDTEPVLLMLSEAEVGDEHSFTAFIQKVEVELF